MKDIIRRIFNKKPKAASAAEHSQPVVIVPRSEHCVSRNNISKNAVKVLYKLNNAGYQAYLVGGGVRDLLLGLRPKDFDIATDATPEEIKQLFRNCRLIGRRFRLAHILFGREVIEVATFRANHDEAHKIKPPHLSARGPIEHAKTSDRGMLMRDNVFGSLEDDAFRRDFTVNAIFYRVTDFALLDYTQGLEDLSKRQLRLIGEPEERYREDPVRILRAIRLSCKLDLKIEPDTLAPIQSLASLLTHVSSARLWDETNKMLLAGHAQSTFNALEQQGVAKYLFPATLRSLSTDQPVATSFRPFIQAALKSTDKRISEQLPVTPAFLFAVFLWQPLLDAIAPLVKNGLPPYEARQKAASQIMREQQECISIPKRFSVMVKEVWHLQFRLLIRRKKSVFSTIQHPRFRAAYDFLCLRAGNDPQLIELAKWWTEFQQLDVAAKNASIQTLGQGTNKNKTSSNKGIGKRKNTKRSPSRTHPNQSGENN